MQRVNYLTALKKHGIVAVLRAESVEKSLKVSDALISGGVKCIEMTFSVPNVENAIRSINEKYQNSADVLIGAGTVLDSVSARIAIMAGAKFIVSPTFDKEIAECCNLYQIPYIPGCMTVTEIQTALKSGSDLVKLFPSDIVGPKFVKNIMAPLPQVSIMPSGGIHLENMKDWIDVGCDILGVGGSLLAPAKDNDFAKITQLAEAYQTKYNELRSK